MIQSFRPVAVVSVHCEKSCLGVFCWCDVKNDYLMQKKKKTERKKMCVLLLLLQIFKLLVFCNSQVGEQVRERVILREQKIHWRVCQRFRKKEDCMDACF